VQIYDNNTHPLDPQARAKNLPVEKENVAPVVIEDDAWIGGNAVILRGVTIGRGSVVAIHSVVTRSVPPMSVAAGNPAVVVKQLRGESADEKSRAIQERPS
jgi:acetyltransferase-like isoleucine patch superfamily enzyme